MIFVYICIHFTFKKCTLLCVTDPFVYVYPGCKPWSNAMEILDEKDGMDTELLVYAMTLINKVPGQYYVSKMSLFLLTLSHMVLYIKLH